MAETFTTETASSINTNGLMDILTRAVMMLGARGGGVYRHDPASRQLVLVAHFNRPAEFCGPIGEHEGICGLVLQSQKDSKISDNYQVEPHRVQHFTHVDFASILALAIRDEGRTVGILFVEDPRPGFFKEEDEFKVRPLAYACRDLLEAPAPAFTRIDNDIVANAPFAVIGAHDGKVVVFNWKATEMFGWERGDILNQDLTQLYADRHIAREMGNDLQTNRSLSNVTAMGKHKNGQIFRMRMSAVMLEDGSSIGYIQKVSEMEPLNAATALLACTTALIGTENLKTGLEALAEKLTVVLDMPLCCIYLRDPQHRRYNLIAACGASPADKIPASEIESMDLGDSEFLEENTDRCRQVSKVVDVAGDFHSGVIATLKKHSGLILIGAHKGVKERRPKELSQLTLSVAHQISAFIKRLRLEENQQKIHARLQSMTEMVDTLLNAPDGQTLLTLASKQLHELSDSWWASLMVVGRNGKTREFSRAGKSGYPINGIQSRNEAGLTHLVITKRLTIVVPDVQAPDAHSVNPRVIEAGVRATLGLPLIYRDRCFGAAWIHFTHVHDFTTGELDSLRIYLQQVAMAYENVETRSQQAKLMKAVTDFDCADDLAKIEDLLLLEIKNLLQIDHVGWCVVGTNDGPPKVYRSQVPNDLQPDLGTVLYGLKQSSPTYHQDIWTSRLPQTFAVGFRIQPGITGLILLKAGSETRFGDRAQTAIEHLARHAAFAMNKVHTSQKMKRSMNLISSISRLFSSPDLNKDLNERLELLHKKTSSKFIGLSLWDRHHKHLRPPRLSGNISQAPPEVNKKSAEYMTQHIVGTGRNHWLTIPNQDMDPILSNFLTCAKITEVLAFPLTSNQQNEGVLFFSYGEDCRPDCFEIDTVSHLAEQVGHLVAQWRIGSENLARSKALATLSSSKGRAITLNTGRIIENLAEQGYRLLPHDNGDMAVEIWMTEEAHLIRKACSGREAPCKSIPIAAAGEEDYMVQQCFAQDVTCYLANTRDIPVGICFTAEETRTMSELAVPLRVAGKVVGVLNVEHNRSYALEGYAEIFEALAVHAGIALECAVLHGQLQEVGAYIGDHSVTEWLSEIGARMSHDINSGVAKAKMALKILLTELDPLMDVEQHTLLTRAQEHIQEIGHLPMMVPLSGEERLGPVCMKLLIEDFQKYITRLHQVEDLHLFWQPPQDESLQVWASANWLHSLLGWLFHNAAHALRENPSDRPPTIWISCTSEEEAIVITVTDNGPGIPAQLQQVIMERPVSRKEGSHGSGFSLVLANRIARKYKGSLALNPKVTEGTEFLLRLPLYHPDPLTRSVS